MIKAAHINRVIAIDKYKRDFAKVLVLSKEIGGRYPILKPVDQEFVYQLLRAPDGAFKRLAFTDTANIAFASVNIR